MKNVILLILSLAFAPAALAQAQGPCTNVTDWGSAYQYDPSTGTQGQLPAGVVVNFTAGLVANGSWDGPFCRASTTDNRCRSSYTLEWVMAGPYNILWRRSPGNDYFHMTDSNFGANSLNAACDRSRTHEIVVDETPLPPGGGPAGPAVGVLIYARTLSMDCICGTI